MARHVRTAPVPPVCTHLEVLQEDASSSVVLEGEQLLSVLTLLVAVLLEEVGEAFEGHVVTGEVEGLRGTRRRKKQWLGDSSTHHYLANSGYAARQWSGT